MFDKIGEKIQIIASLLFILDCIACVVLAIICWSNELVGLGFICLLLGPIVSYISTLFIAGFGKIIENTDKMSANTSTIINQNRKLQAKPSITETFKNLGSKITKLKPGWTCSCGQKNNGEAKACINCGKEKKADSNTPTSAWTCSCGAENDGGLFCKVCGKFKNAKQPIVASDNNEEISKAVTEEKIENTPKVSVDIRKKDFPTWTCSCGEKNRVEAKACINCGKERPENVEISKPKVEEKKAITKQTTTKAWFCKCGQPNLIEDTKCIRCKTPISKGRVPASTFPGVKVWRCSCGKMNSSADLICINCGKEKNK